MKASPVKLRKNGQVTIPVKVREALELEKGDLLELNVERLGGNN